LRASAKQWTVVMALSLGLGGLTTLVGPQVSGQNMQSFADSTQTQSTSESAARPPVARLLTGGELASGTEAAGQRLLAARKALAQGDTQAARQHLAPLAGSPAELGARDSAAAVESLIRQHERLMEMAASGEPSEYNRQASQFLLRQAEQLLGYGDWQTAEQLANAAASFGNFGGEITSAAVLQRATAMKQLSPEQIGQRRNEAAGLMSKMQMALEQDRLAEASQALASLKALHLPDTAYADLELRPWQLELQLQSKLQAAAPVQQAQTGDELPGAVRTAGFQPEGDTSRVVLVSTEATEASGQFDDDAIDLYLQGVKALNAGNRQRAQELMDRAWAKRDELEPSALAALEQRRAFLRNTVATMPVSTTAGNRQDSDRPVDLDSQGQVLLQKIRQHVLRQRAAADKLMEENQPRQALAIWHSLRADIEKSDLESAPKSQFLTMADREIERLSQFISQHIVEIETAEANISRINEVSRERNTRYSNEVEIQRLVEEFNRMQAQQRFAEANVIARQAQELDSQNPAVVSMVQKGLIAHRNHEQKMLREAAEHGRYEAWTDVERSAVLEDPTNPFGFPGQRVWSELTASRRQWAEEQSIGDPTEYRIRQVLRNFKVAPVFEGTPLVQALDLLGQEAGINIAYDSRGMSDENVDTATPVNLVLHKPISLQSALQLILSNLNLDYVIEDEVIKITSRSSAAPKLQRVQYYVGDLVHPIPNFQGVNPITIFSAGGVVTSGGMGLSGQVGTNGGQMGTNGGQLVGALAATTPGNAGPSAMYPLALAQQLDPALAGGYSRLPSSSPTVDPLTGQGGMMAADFTSLINLIQTTVDPMSWEENGGPQGATITEFRNTNSLVIRNTQAVHDQIQDLLKRLRELQDVQIVIETRFISLSDSFFERIGVDFDFQLNDYSGLPLGVLDDERSRSAIIGRLGTPDLTIPADFDIPFSQNSFGESVPQFGGFGDPATAANFGFAILSDIEVFFLIQAAKGDQRSNVMTAPKITLFNGQFGSVTDVVTRNFVTSVTPVVGAFAAAHAPVISTLADGTMMSVQAVVSHDRRFVRLTLVPTFTRLDDVQEFTFSGSTTTNTGSGVFDPTDGRFLSTNRLTETTGVTVQQPVFAITSVSATVAVPDGGTVLLGGVKRLSEARVERGVPFLSNLPWINRLFKNVGIGRDTSNLMLMVTPRVIIKEEEEARQVGLTP